MLSTVTLSLYGATNMSLGGPISPQQIQHEESFSGLFVLFYFLMILFYSFIFATLVRYKMKLLSLAETKELRTHLKLLSPHLIRQTLPGEGAGSVLTASEPQLRQQASSRWAMPVSADRSPPCRE